jgi:hypothetical protein
MLREPLDNPGVGPRLSSKSLAASKMLRVLVEVFQSFLRAVAEQISFLMGTEGHMAQAHKLSFLADLEGLDKQFSNSRPCQSFASWADRSSKQT